MIEIKGEIFIPFEWIDKTPGGSNLGRAEFMICIKFRRKQVSEFWVYPKQQRREDCWHYSGGERCFDISSYEKLKREGAWLISFCPEHKTQSISVYAPDGAKFLRITSHGIAFCMTDWSAK